MKMFKAKKIIKRKRNSKLKALVFTFFFFFSYVFAYYHSKEYKYDKNMLYDDINYVRFNLLNTISNKLEESINKPVNLLNNNIKISKKNDIKQVSYIKKEEPNIYSPIIYVYNTHGNEKYNNYTVYDAALELANKLNNNGLDTYFEKQSVSAFLQSNNLKYYESYNVSRRYLEEAKNNYKNLSYFFDIHRDALSREKSTITINNESYAKILFVVGKENKNYETNLNNANKLNEIINKKVPGISRGVLKKEGKTVDGVYNQDIGPNTFLIEIGGNYNEKEEVLRTVAILSEAITEYIKGVI